MAPAAAGQGARHRWTRPGSRPPWWQEVYAPPPAPAPEPAGAGGDDLTADLRRLAELENQGILSEEEFAAAKAKLLGM